MEFSAENQRQHTIAKGETMSSIAEQCQCTLSDLAKLNFGYDDPDTVARGLFEIVGTRFMPDDWQDYEFEGDESSRGTGELSVPEDSLTDDAEVNTSYEFVVTSPCTPVGVEIRGLDKWFVPGTDEKDGEACQISYHVHGDEYNPTYLSFQVFASNYCEIGAAVADTPLGYQFTTLEAQPIYNEELGEIAPGTDGTINWQGQTNTTKGMLATTDPKNPAYANVALSPYTALLRYGSSSDDTDALLQLDDFWPTWAGDEWAGDERAVDSDSLKIGWQISNSEKKLTHGQIIIFDRRDEVVFRFALDSGKVGDGVHSFQWDGVLSNGDNIVEKDMPYRVQIQAHSDKDEMQGLALAAMHTEVRMFVDQKAIDKNEVQNALNLGVTTPHHEEPDKADSVAWAQYRLAMGGIHAGPVNGVEGDDTQRAVREFQRAYPKNSQAPFSRLNVTGTVDNDTLSALQHLAEETRPFFGDPDDRSPLSLAEAGRKFADSDEELILWIYDDNYYSNRWDPRIPSPMPHQLNDYRPLYHCSDAELIQAHAADVCRPWIAVQCVPRILGRDTGGAGTSHRGYLSSDAVRPHIGPIRVNWKALDQEPDHDRIDTSHPAYKKRYVRTRAWVERIYENSISIVDDVYYHNCREYYGGIRPDSSAGPTDVAEYMKRLFGQGESESRFPFVSALDANAKTSYTVFHSAFGQDMAKIVQAELGAAGSFFRPSIVGGDRYRLRAEVSFEECPNGATFPNWEVLKRRYPIAPCAESSALTVWRHSRVKALIPWTDKKTRDVGDFCNSYLEPGFVHVAYSDDLVCPPRDLMSNADLQTLCQRHVTHADYAGRTAIVSENCIWPFSGEKGLGVPPSARRKRAGRSAQRYRC